VGPDTSDQDLICGVGIDERAAAPARSATFKALPRSSGTAAIAAATGTAAQPAGATATAKPARAILTNPRATCEIGKSTAAARAACATIASAREPTAASCTSLRGMATAWASVAISASSERASVPTICAGEPTPTGRAAEGAGTAAATAAGYGKRRIIIGLIHDEAASAASTTGYRCAASHAHAPDSDLQDIICFEAKIPADLSAATTYTRTEVGRGGAIPALGAKGDDLICAVNRHCEVLEVSCVSKCEALRVGD
jgi:hypothetical protein